MTQVPPAPAAPAPAAPPTPTPQSFADGPVADAVRDRLATAFPEGNQPGTPAAPAAPPIPPPPPGTPAPPAAAPEPEVPDFFTDAGLDALIGDDMPYRDAKRLRDEMAKARDTYRPFRDAFSGLDEQGRQALLDAAPNLGADLGLVANITSQLAESDRAYFIDAMALIAQGTPQSIEQGAQMLADGAAQLRGAGVGTPPPGTQPAPDWATPDPNAPLPGAPVPMTRDEVNAMFAERDRERAVAEEQTRIQAEIIAEAKGLGYDPDAQPRTEAYDRYTYLLTLAGQHGDGIAQAHERVQRQEQAVIDRFVAGKSADAGRPAVPAAAGTAPAETRTLETMADAHAAANARLDAVLGPDARRRVSE